MHVYIIYAPWVLYVVRKLTSVKKLRRCSEFLKAHHTIGIRVQTQSPRQQAFYGSIGLITCSCPRPPLPPCIATVYLSLLIWVLTRNTTVISQKSYT